MKNLPPWIWLAAAALYVICPLDFDFVPVFGWIDDVAVAYLGIKAYLNARELQNQGGAQAASPSSPDCKGIVVDAVRVKPSERQPAN